jgi:type II secretory pathway component GspD/PulD (secretin)
MGGIYVSDQEETSAGFPILKDIPIIGALFGNKSTTNNHDELIFFITPRILNAKEAGLGT